MRKKYYKSDLLTKNSWLAICKPFWEIKSSNKKDFYVVEAHEAGFTCECLGFSRWTKCKHIQYVEAKVKLATSWDY
jgi:hypothetical protein